MQKQFDKKNERWLFPLLCLLLCIYAQALFYGHFTKFTGVLAGVALTYLFATQDLRALRSPFAWPLFGYVAFAALTVIWAMSGKFFLREYLKIFIGFAICLWLMLRPKFDSDFTRRVMSVIACTSAIYAFFSVEAATFGVVKAFFALFSMEIRAGWVGTRLVGVFGNSNIEASVYALGIFFSVALLNRVEERRERISYCVMLSFSALGFLLVFSMGATACFIAAVVLYLVCAGKDRAMALVRMLEAAIPTLLFAMTANLLFNRPGLIGKLPLLVMLLNAAATVFLELTVSMRLIDTFNAHARHTVGFLAAAFALAALYAFLALTIHTPHTFGGSIARQLTLAPGEHTITYESTGDLRVIVESRSEKDVILGTNERILGSSYGYFTPSGTEFTFSVPQGSISCVFMFESREPGVVLTSVTVDGSRQIPLDYPLLPDFVTARIQGLLANTSAVTRLVYMRDGLKIWRLNPVVGSGVGAYEVGVLRVEQFGYRTRYVHNHYVQTLLETGAVGFALWVGSLVAMIAALWRQRKAADSPYRWAYAALWSALAMLILQSLWDVSLSFVVYILYAYTLFGLILRICVVEPEAAKAAEAEAAPGRKKGAAVKKEEFSLGRVIVMLLPAAFVLTLCGNIVSQDLLARPVSGYDQFFSNAQSAIRLDAYEHNDAKVSYIVAAMQVWDETSAAVREQADVYARELAEVQSNSIPATLANFYLNTRRYEEAIDAAKLCAVYSAADEEAWNGVCNMLRQVFADPMYSPLAVDGAPLVQKLLEYRALLEAYNATAIVPVLLSEENQTFLDKMTRLDPYPEDDPAAVFAVLLS